MIGKKILVADDSLTIQKVIRLALSNEGYEIQTVSDGNDAIQQIAVFRPDVVLIDVSLPGKTAFEVKKIVENGKDFAPVRLVLMLSAYEKVDEAQIQEARFHGRLTKPFDPAHLRKILSEVLSSEPLAATTASTIPNIPNATNDWNESSIESGMELPPLPSAAPELPIQDSPKAPMTQDLWDQDGEFIMPPPPPAIPPGLSAQFSPPPVPSISELLQKPSGMPETENPNPMEPDGDIKHLTESTIRMSGLDDFQWSVNEPTLKPPAAMTEPAPIPISSAIGDDSDFGIALQGGMPAGIPGYTPGSPPPPGAAIVNGSIPGLIQAGPANDFMDQPMEFHDDEMIPPPPGSSSGRSGAITASRQELDELVQKHLEKAVEEALKKFAMSTLPEVAERVIKQEIHKMLSEL